MDQIGNPNWLLTLKQVNHKCNDNEGLVNQKGIYGLLSHNLPQLLSVVSTFHDQLQVHLSCYYFHQLIKRLILIKHVY